MRQGRAAIPRNPAPRRSAAGNTVLPVAEATTSWDVGTRLGAALRKATAQAASDPGGASEPTGRHVRGHIRRAHWHTFVTGPRKHADGSVVDPSDRPRSLRWLPPLPINLDTYETLPSVIRPVG